MKNEIRNVIKAKRREMTKSQVGELSNACAEIFLKSVFYKNSKQIMIYQPLGNETDTTLIKETAFRDGKKLVFPVTDGESGDITPYIITKETVFSKGAFNVSEPQNCELADMSKTEVILVPGIGFDLRGNRIGFGKGCYDRLLAETSGTKIGYCYGFQVVSDIPSEVFDVKMDYIITENGLIKCE